MRRWPSRGFALTTLENMEIRKDEEEAEDLSIDEDVIFVQEVMAGVGSKTGKVEKVEDADTVGIDKEIGDGVEDADAVGTDK